MAIYACELPPALQKAATKKTVLLWGHENLLGYSVETLLNTRNCLDLVMISKDLGVEALFEQAQALHPDVVIIYQSNCSNIMDLPMRLMQNQARLKVILVTLENNSVQVFNKQQVLINESSDLFSIVEGCPRLPCPIDLAG